MPIKLMYVARVGRIESWIGHINIAPTVHVNLEVEIAESKYYNLDCTCLGGPKPNCFTQRD